MASGADGLADGAKEFEVDKVLDKKVGADGVEYHIMKRTVFSAASHMYQSNRVFALHLLLLVYNNDVTTSGHAT